MNLEMKIKGIEIRKVCDDWSCVKAKKRFSKGEVIEVCPGVEITKRDSYFIEETELSRLCFLSKGKLFLPSGYSWFYIPLKNPNASSEVLPKERALVITANQTIKKGESIYVGGRNFSFSSKPKEDYNEPFFWHSDGLIVKPSSKHGLGVFTTKSFKKGEFVEVCSTFPLTEKESWLVEETKLDDFTYTFGSRNQLASWAMGYPCFYNHSYQPNVNPCVQLDYIINFHHLAVRALKDLKPNTELVYDYTGGNKNKKLGFKPV